MCRGYPFTAQIRDSDTPVLPAVYSTTAPPALRRPSASAASIMASAMRSFMLPGSLYFTTDFHPPWGVRVPPRPRLARFHLVVRGSCWVRAAGQPRAIRLEAGDLVLVPHGSEHTLSDAPETADLTVDPILERTGFSGRGDLVCGGGDGRSATRAGP